MKYRVHLGDQAFEVELEPGTVRLDGASLEAEVMPLRGTPLYHVLVAGEAWTVAAEELAATAAWALGSLGERVEVTVEDADIPPSPGPAGGGHGARAAGTLHAPMPGLVVRVEVSVGQRVEAGTGLVVVEAMKMENELRASGAGVVAAVHVAAGEAVEKGAPLVTLASGEAI